MCPMCDCEEVRWAAPLGSLVHACCRGCGWVYEVTVHGEACVGTETCEEVE
jgi:hypothetical protein